MFATKQSVAALDTRFSECDKKVNGLDGKVCTVEQELNNLINRFNNLNLGSQVPSGSSNNDYKSLLDRLNAFEKNLDSLNDKMEGLTSIQTQFKPSNGGGGAGAEDVQKIMMMITKLQSDMKQKANQGDIGMLKEMVDRKTDRQEFEREVKRLEKLIESLNQVTSDLSDKQN
jgi:archaellum component FlaC